MRLHNGTVLKHGPVPYDPVKAHAYYIRTRQLKGRKTGRAGAHPRSLSSVTRSPTFTVTSDGGHTVKLTGQQLAEQKAYAAKRVAAIKKSLAELSTALHKMVAEAKAKESKSKREANKAPSAADKSKAARDSKQYRDTHKQELANKSKKASAKKSAKQKDPVAELEGKITQVKGRLMAAIARQRNLSTATRNS